MKKKIYIGKIATLVVNTLTVLLLGLMAVSVLMLNHQHVRNFTWLNLVNYVVQNYDIPLVACGLGNSILALVAGIAFSVVVTVKKQHKNFLYEPISFILAGLICGFALRYYSFIRNVYPKYIGSFDKAIHYFAYLTFIIAFLTMIFTVYRFIRVLKGEVIPNAPKKVKVAKPVLANLSKEEKRIAKEKAREEELRRREEERRAREKEKELQAKKREQEKIALAKARAEALANREKEKEAAEKARKLRLEQRKKELAQRYKEKQAAKAARIQAKLKAREAKEAERSRREAIKAKEKKAALLAAEREKAKLAAQRLADKKKREEARIAAEKRRAYLKSDAYKAKKKLERRKRRYIRHYMLTHK